jgi:hypothetical protein
MRLVVFILGLMFLVLLSDHWKIAQPMSSGAKVGLAMLVGYCIALDISDSVKRK